MRYSLKKMLSNKTAIPYNDEIIQTLADACDSYNVEDCLETISELTKAFISGIIPSGFRNHIQNAIEGNEPVIIVPNEALVCLAQYAALTRIQEEEDSLKQSVYATMLMNYMLVLRNQFEIIPNKEEILSVYKYHLAHYISSHDNTKIGTSSKLRSRVPRIENVTSEFTADNIEEIRAVYKESAFYMLFKRLEAPEISNIENPFVRMYCGLTDMLDNIPYFYYDISIDEVFSKICTEKELKSRKKLSSILSDIRSHTNDGEYRDDTSVLLRAIDKEDLDSSAWVNVLNQQFNLKEFSIYLYFEILTEKILDTL